MVTSEFFSRNRQIYKIYFVRLYKYINDFENILTYIG